MAILGLSILAAAWIIASPDWIAGLGMQNDKLIDIISYIPAMGVVLMMGDLRPEFIACERRTFKRILGIR